MRRIIRGVLAAVVLIFCFCAVGMTGRDSGTTESREEEAVPESRETERILVLLNASSRSQEVKA